MEKFEEVRDAFHAYCADVAAVALDLPEEATWQQFFEANLSDLPAELVKWTELSTPEFAAFLASKLGPYVGLLESERGRAVVMNKMIEGVADMDDEFSAFLLFVEQTPEDRDAFCDFLHTLTLLAETL